MPGDTAGPRKIPLAGVPASTPGTADLTQSFLTAFRRTRQEAGAPSYRALARKVGYCSAPTIWRAFNSGKLPGWETTETILLALRVDRGLITSRWRVMWRQAWDEADHREDRTPVRSGPAAPSRELPAGGLRGLSGHTSPTGDQDLAAGHVCEDCGAVIGNLIHHQAWHWRIERQLSRATLRPVEGTGQLPALTPDAARSGPLARYARVSAEALARHQAGRDPARHRLGPPPRRSRPPRDAPGPDPVMPGRGLERRLVAGVSGPSAEFSTDMSWRMSVSG